MGWLRESMNRLLDGRVSAVGLYLGASLAALVFGVGVLSPGLSLATGALTYPPPLLSGISCPSKGLCVAVDDKGHAVISTDPTASTPTWSRWAMHLVGPPEEISCPSTSLCVAVDFFDAAISTNPTAPIPTWSAPIRIDSAGAGLSGVSCVGTSLCVAVTENGYVTITTNPTAPAPTWSAPRSIDTTALTGISCPSTSLCVAVDSTGAALTSTDPTDPKPTWSAPASIDPSAGLAGISCASASLCIAVDERDDAVISTNPDAAAPTWSAPAATGIPYNPQSDHFVGISCPLSAFCMAVGGAPVIGATLTNATAATRMWSVVTGFEGEASEEPPSASCASATLCVITDGASARISTDPTAPAPTWSQPTVIDRLPAGRLSLPGAPSISGSTLSFRLDCSIETPFFQECSGAATLTTTERLAANGRAISGVTAAPGTKRHRTVVIGRSTFVIPPNEAGPKEPHPVHISLDSTGRRLLSTFKRLPATLTLTATTPEPRIPPTTLTIKTARVTFTTKATSRRKK